MKKIAAIILIALLSFLIVKQLKSSYDKVNKAEMESGISTLVNVNVSTVTEKETDLMLCLTGTLYPIMEMDISAEAQGRITYLEANLGEYITQGSTIAVIDNELKQLAVKNAEITEAKSKRDVERWQNLYKGGTATAQQLEEAVNAFDMAEIQLEQAKKQLSDATVTAPSNGVITEKYVEQGTYINPGNPVIRMIDLSTLKLKANVSEVNIYKLKQGDMAIITTDIYPGHEFAAHITYVGVSGDESHNYPIEVVMANSEKYPLRAGTFAEVNITVPGTSRALFIPRRALVGSTQDASVYIAENGKAILKKMVIQSNGSEELQVISGLSKGDTIIVNGQINLQNGREIQIVEN